MQMSPGNPFSRSKMPGGFPNNPKKEILSAGSEEHSSFISVYSC